MDRVLRGKNAKSHVKTRTKIGTAPFKEEMPRIARAVAVGIPHHITQRGNYRQVVFEEDSDYRQYLEWLKHYSNKYSLRIWAYCLMNNHVHFVAVPENEESMARAFNTLHMRYAQYSNAKRGDKGHLWQGRYYSTALDERHLYAAMRYVGSIGV